MTQTEALKLALEWLDTDDSQKIKMAQHFIKEALAQPEQCKYGQEPKSCTSSPMDCQCAIDATLAQPVQEPVAWLSEGGNFSFEPWKGSTPLYTTPPQRTWVGLTEKDMDWLHENTPCIEGNYGYRFIKAIEAKLKEKNT